MGHDPKSGTLREVNDELLSRHPEAQHWQQFSEGEIVLVKRNADLARPFVAKFRIAELSENRIVLVAVGAEKLAQKAAHDEMVEQIKAEEKVRS